MLLVCAHAFATVPLSLVDSEVVLVDRVRVGVTEPRQHQVVEKVQTPEGALAIVRVSLKADWSKGDRVADVRSREIVLLIGDEPVESIGEIDSRGDLNPKVYGVGRRKPKENADAPFHHTWVFPVPNGLEKASLKIGEQGTFPLELPSKVLPEPPIPGADVTLEIAGMDRLDRLQSAWKGAHFKELPTVIEADGGAFLKLEVVTKAKASNNLYGGFTTQTAWYGLAWPGGGSAAAFGQDHMSKVADNVQGEPFAKVVRPSTATLYFRIPAELKGNATLRYMGLDKVEFELP